MAKDPVFEGRCWKFGDNVPTGMMAPTHIMFKAAKETAAYVLEAFNSDGDRLRMDIGVRTVIQKPGTSSHRR